jgi:SAM-dependent methyltransferase
MYAKARLLLRQRQYGLLVRKTLTTAYRAGRAVLEAVDSFTLAGFRSPKSVIRRVWPGEQTIVTGEEFRLVLYAHYDRDGIVDDYVVYQLAHLADLPAKIIFVSTAPHLTEESVRRIQPYCHTVIQQKNIGLDFGSWKTAMAACAPVVDSAKTLILMNDSCYGPLYSLRDVVQSLESKKGSLTGITANYDTAYHIQSYFILFPEDTVKSAFFSEFREGLAYIKGKLSIIRRFEIGTSVLAGRHGIPLHPWVQLEDLIQDGAEREDLQDNLTIFQWERLLRLKLTPFVKRSLFGESKIHLGDQEPLLWKHLCAQTEYPLSLIENHLFRLGIPPSKVPDWDVYQSALTGKKGVEIGGPSDTFEEGSFLPVYEVIEGLDGADFSHETTWLKRRKDGDSFPWHQHKSPGRLFIVDGTNLLPVPDRKYDFVLSCHVLEHMANPLQAIQEWIRVLVPGGSILLILPRKEATFDHRRPVTSMAHLLEDYTRGTSENDLSHLEEILALHDLERDPLAGTLDAFRKRSLDNKYNRCLHHHVFDLELARTCLTHFGLKVLSARLVGPLHQVVLAQKTVEETVDAFPFNN